MTLSLIMLGVFCSGILVGVVLMRYGLRVGNRLTIAAQNQEPIDLKPMPEILQEMTE